MSTDRRAPDAGALAITKLADVGTTAYALERFPDRIAEANPIPAAVFDAVGVLEGLALLAVIAIAGVVSATELGARVADQHGGDPRVVRTVGYVPLSVIFGLIALHNLRLIAGVI